MTAKESQTVLLVGAGAAGLALWWWSRTSQVAMKFSYYRAPDPEPQVPKTLGDYLEESLRTAPVRLPKIDIQLPPPPNI